MTEANFIEVDYNPFEEGKEIEKVIILNESQKEIWLSCVIGGDPASLAYNESISLQLSGRFNLRAFQEAVKLVTSRHEALRANVSKDGENLIVYNQVDNDIIFTDFSDIDSALIPAKLKDFVTEKVGVPFNLYDDALFKIFIHKLDEETHYFTIIIHHIIGDGWSLGIILEDLSNCYNITLSGIKSTLALPDQISKYALEQVIFSKTDEYYETQQFWLNQYKNNIPVLDMPLDFSRPTTRTYEGKRNDYVVDSALYNSVKNLSVKAKSSVVSTLIAAFEVFLYNQTGQEEIVLGLPSAGQLASENLNLVGHCVNLLPLRSKIDPNATFLDYLLKRKNEILDAYDHQRLTFSELLKKLNIKRNKANIPLVPVVFNVDRGMDDAVNFSGLTHKIISNPRVCQTFEISLNVNGSKDSMIFEWAYNTQLFTSETINRMMNDFVSLLSNITSNPQVLISNTQSNTNPFPEITPAHCDYPKEKTIVDLFNETVNESPNQTAVVFEGKSLSYEQLNIKSNQLANYLIDAGLKKGTLIPICIHSSLETVISIFGILKTGAAYVPIDPEYPSSRIKFLTDESQGNFVISDKMSYQKISESFGGDIICLDDANHQVWQAKKENPSVSISPEALIYIIYTSGSTGNPKGVMIPHSAIVDYLFGLKTKLTSLKNCKNFALGSAISTDLGNTTLFSALTLGASLHLFAKDRFNNPEYIHEYFNQNTIDFLKVVPSHWKFLNHKGKLLTSDKILMFGGEALPAEYIKQIKALNASCEIVNHYGPTETTIGKLVHLVDKDYDYPIIIPIGKPFSNTSIHVLNKHLKYCPVGVPGELHIGGDGLAKGYLNNDELTQKSFIQNPNTNFEDNRIYKTGDLVKWLPDGNILYLGRIDDQVKILGNRIELGEIQNILQKHPNVKQSAVLTTDSDGDEKQLVAYLVTENVLDKESIISFLRSQLPEYMIPRILIELDNIPLTSNGKVDRKALPQYDVSEQVDKNTFVEPRNREQELVAKIWAESLELDKISITDDFFELGGHSMIAIKVMVEIEKQTGIRLPLAILFDNSTIEKFALQLNKTKQEITWGSLIPIKKSGNRPPLYIIHGQGMNIIIFKSLAGEIDKDQPVYGLQPRGLNPEEDPFTTIEDIAAGYIQEILKENPNGPYLIMGYSSGGTIALEMAHQLQKMNKNVLFLGLLDTYYDGDSYLKLIKDTNFSAVFSHVFKTVSSAFLYLSKYPKAYINHNISFTLGSMYNFYKKFNPIKMDLSNPKYVLDKIQKTHEIALNKYKLKKYNVNVHLFKANDKKMNYVPNMDTNGWAPYVGGELTIVDIPLEHLQFFDPKYVHVFSEKLQEVLDGIQK
ncbi:non-ribosomal peptide synthetase [Pedobacter jamesrossensis]|uniref:Amino acid adenylation domain-containing protein n=2 Tax=Pedobacter jamesrossensis TaxID=1908238 RepID=A0ABV8NLC7_9SPHI